MKRILSVLLALSLCLSLFAGVAFAEGEQFSGTLDVWHYWSSDLEHQLVKEMEEGFEAKYPGVDVVVTCLARDELYKQYIMGAVSGELPDIGMMDNPDMNAYIKMGLCADVTDLFEAWPEKDFYYEGPLNSCMDEGRVYGIPHNSNCLAMFYDIDMLEKAGASVPATWDELLDTCAKLKEAFPDAYPLGFSANNNEEGTFQFMSFLLSTGATIDQLDSEGAIKAVSFWKELLDKGYAPKDVISWGQSEVNNRFMSGNVIMQINGPWNVGNLRADVPDKNWGVTLIPRDQKYASVLGGENFAITSACENLELGWAFLTYMCSGENTANFCAQLGKFAPRSDGSQYSDFWTTDPIMEAFNEGMQYAMPRGPHPRWSEFSAVISNALQEVLTGTKTPEAAMADAQKAGVAVMAN